MPTPLPRPYSSAAAEKGLLHPSDAIASEAADPLLRRQKPLTDHAVAAHVVQSRTTSDNHTELFVLSNQMW